MGKLISTLATGYYKARLVTKSSIGAMKWHFGLALVVSAFAIGSCWTSYSPKFQYMQYAAGRREDPKSFEQCRILDSGNFFRSTPEDIDDQKHQLVFLTEFSRFMNSKSLSLLSEFAKSKKIFDWSKKIYKSVPGVTPRDLASARHRRQVDIDSLEVDAASIIKKMENRQDSTVAETTTAESESETTTPSTTTPSSLTTTSPNASGSDDAMSIEDLLNQFLGNAAGLIDSLSTTTDVISDALQNSMGPEMWTNWCTAVWWPYDEEKCVQTRCLACSPSVMSASVVCEKTIGRTDDIKCLRDVMGEGHCNYCISEFV